MQRDKEPAREISRTFNSFRGELTLQPERSGHYAFTFTHVSDANYRKKELDIPTIEQTIHPLASADFVDPHTGGRGKRQRSTCSGDSIDVQVELRVSFAILCSAVDMSLPPCCRVLHHGLWSFKL